MTENSRPSAAIVAVIDDDQGVRDALDGMLRSVGLQVVSFASTQDYLDEETLDGYGCIILDVRLPGRSGLDFQDDLAKLNVATPVIIISGHADVPMSVRAMKAGAVEFLTKPVRAQDLLDAVDAALAQDRAARLQARRAASLNRDFETLTSREREVFKHVACGLMNKQIAAVLGLSEATVKLHRGSVMRKMRAGSIADLVRMADRLGFDKVMDD
ncbi:response regulator transcription factor [Rhodopseudomonas sp. P2A-2r]|uniref:response regulator transcription factor n=1 Tax=unclassified Rhodopseudomonas TaxID=2638247 RepID=UPI002234C61B|nr:response regulator [Rhodopseudomonas sp. P2A-2r]UZE49890.1 response regulator [Rhodopseudomonas sp. P2A-2r]